MDVLPLHFRTLRIFGVWHESDKPHWLLTYIWRPFNVNVMLFFTISQLGALSIYRDNVNDFTECLFLSLTYFGLCFKLVNFLARRPAMTGLLSEFRADICQPRDDREREIVDGYESIIALVFNLHVVFAQSNGVLLGLMPLVSMLVGGGGSQMILPYKTYEVIDKTDPLQYWGTYAFQVVADAIGIFVNVTLDTMLAGFLLLTCAQIDLCCRRFAESSVGEIRRSIVECVRHQLLVRRIVTRLASMFMCVVLPLMFLSLITFCTSVYNISQADTSGVEAISFFIYIVCLLCQLGCYCWFGNELKLKSTAISETMYNSDWTAMKLSDRRSLYFIMLSCDKELSLSFHGFCTLTIYIFVWVLKTSYSAYNLLKTVEK